MNRNRENGENRFAYLVNAPMIIYLACFLAFPMVWGLYMSFTNKTIGNPASFVGFKNYIRLLGDAEYRRSILNIVVVYNWRWIFNSTGGIANYILKSLHITNTDIIWFGSAGLAMTTIIVANVWRGTPFFGVSILAKLQTIPKDYYEAAEIDGAGLWQKFRHITLPEVKDVTILSALMSTIWTINEFETVWLLTGGGPNGTTEVMNVYSYKTAMRSMMLGRGIAVAVLAMPVLMILISILTRRMLPEGE